MRHYVIVTNSGQVDEYDADDIQGVLHLFSADYGDSWMRIVYLAEVDR